MNYNKIAILVLLSSHSVAALADCAASGSNDIANCGFESGDPPDSWTLNTGVLTLNMATPKSGSIAAQIDAIQNVPDPFFATIDSDCFAVNDDASYGFGAHFRLVSGATPSCRVTPVGYTSMNCGTGVTALPNSPNVSVPTGVWTQSATTIDASGIGSMHFQLHCSAGSDFVVLMDDVFAGPGLVPVELQSFSID